MKKKQQKEIKARSKKAHINHKQTTEGKETRAIKLKENKLTDGRRFGKKWFREH